MRHGVTAGTIMLAAVSSFAPAHAAGFVRDKYLAARDSPNGIPYLPDEFVRGEYLASRDGEPIVVSAGQNGDAVISLRCDDNNAPQAGMTRLRDGVFRVVFDGLEAPAGADFKLEIYEYSQKSENRIDDVLLDELAYSDIAGEIAGSGRALSRPISPKYDGKKWRCPTLRAELVPANDAGVEATVEIRQISYSYRQTGVPSLHPQGDVHPYMNMKFAKSPLFKEKHKFSAVKAFANSIAHIKKTPHTGQPTECTGFPIGARHFLTNYHCLYNLQTDASPFSIPADCRDVTALIGEIDYQSRRIWDCVGVVFASKSLDAAVLELQPPKGSDDEITYAILPARLDLAPRPEVEINNTDYSTILLHHLGGGVLEVSHSCGKVSRIDDATRYALSLQGIPFSEATILHGCNSDKGSSGSPLIAVSADGISIIGLHHSDYLRDDYEEAGYGGCISNFVKKYYPSFEFKNLASDAGAVRCAIEKAGVAIGGLRSSPECLAATTPEEVTLPDKRMIEEMQKECSGESN